MSQLTFVIVNRAKTSSLVSQVTSDWLAKVCSALLVQLNRDFSPHWGGEYMVREDVTSLPGEVVFMIVDELPDAPTAIAYHDVDGNDVPVAFLALSTCNTLDDVSVALSHECLETGGDAGANKWADDGKGAEWALEACDAVEAFSYDVNGVKVSDFVLPSFFDRDGRSPYSHIGNGVAPFRTSAGYQIRRDATGVETQVTGHLAAHRAAKLKHWSCRAVRRGARV